MKLNPLYVCVRLSLFTFAFPVVMYIYLSLLLLFTMLYHTSFTFDLIISRDRYSCSNNSCPRFPKQPRHGLFTAIVHVLALHSSFIIFPFPFFLVSLFATSSYPFHSLSPSEKFPRFIFSFLILNFSLYLVLFFFFRPPSFVLS